MANIKTSRESHDLLSPCLHNFPITREALTAECPDITDFICGAFIFSPKCQEDQSSPPRVLLLQRASSKSENQWPGTWDFPGGRFETSNPDLVATVQREVFEETGRHVSRLEHFVGITYWTKGPGYGNRKWGKFCFVVEVEEMRDIAPGFLDKVPITLSKDEHQDFMWGTREMVENGGLTFIGENGNAIILDAFANLNEAFTDTGVAQGGWQRACSRGAHCPSPSRGQCHETSRDDRVGGH